MPYPKPIPIQIAREQLSRIDAKLKTPHLLIGGLAVRQYVVTRNSHDIDLVLDHQTFRTILSDLYPSHDWEIKESKANAYRPTVNISHHSQDLGEIVFGPKITEREPYQFLDWDYLLNEGIPVSIDGQTFSNIIVPRCAHLAFSKLISFLGRDQLNFDKRRQDLVDLRDLSNQKQFDPISFLSIARRMGALEYIKEHFTPTVEEQLIAKESSFFALANAFSLSVEFRNDTDSIDNEHTIIQMLLNHLLKSPRQGVLIRDLIALIATNVQGKSEVTNSVRTALALLVQLGLIQYLKPDSVRFESDLAHAFIASLKAHGDDHLPMLSGWSDQTASLQHYNWNRELLRDLEITRVSQPNTVPSPARSVHSVIIIVKATVAGEDLFLMEYNPSWDGGMWWFLGGVLGSDQHNIVEEASERLQTELGLHKNCYEIVDFPEYSEISDRRISERLGVFSHYRYSVLAAVLNKECSRNQALCEREFAWHTQSGRVRMSRNFKWMSWKEIMNDHPLAHHAGNILAELNARVPQMPVSPLEVSKQIHDMIRTTDYNRNFSAVILDAGGIIFDDEFWFDKVKRYYAYYRETTTHAVVSMPFAQYATHSRLLSISGHAMESTTSTDIFHQFSKGLGYNYGEGGHNKAGEIMPGVIDVLKSLMSFGVDVYILTSAPWRSDEFDSRHGEALRDEAGTRLYKSSLSTKELGVTKLSGRLFKIALEQWGLSADQALFVGHDIHELVGAKYGGGITTVAVNVHHSEISVARTIADYCVSRFEDVLRIVRVAQ